MAFNINDIKAKVHGMRGLQVPNLCRLKFYTTNTNQVSTFAGAKNLDALSLLGYKFQVPNLTIATTEIKRQGFGPIERRANNYVPSTLAVELFLDNNNLVLDFLNNWASAHVQYQPGSATDTVKMKEGAEAFFGQVGYFDDYAMDIDIEIYDPSNNKIVNYRIVDAIISNLGTIELGWQQNNELTTISLQLSYRGIIPSTETAPEGKKGDKGLNLFQFISKMKGAVEVVKSFEKPSNVQDALNLLNNVKTLGHGFTSGSEKDKF
jgi:hypothetical protein